MTGRPVVGLAPKSSGAGGRPVVGLAPAPGTTPRSTGGHGLLGEIGHVLKQGGIDLKDVAVHTPGGIYAIEKAIVHDTLRGHAPILDPGGLIRGNTEVGKLVHGQVKQTAKDLRHPLRHPGYTLLDVLPFVNAAGKVIEAGALAARGGSVGDVARAALTRQVRPPHTLRHGDLEVKVGASQSTLGYLGQRGYHSALERAAKGEGRVGGAARRKIESKVGRAVAQEAHVVQDTHKAEGAALIALGRKLKPAEQKALQIVAEEAPLERRITAASARVLRATGKEQKRHQAELDLLHKAREHLGEANGKPVFSGPQAPKLNRVLGRMREVSGSREELLKQLGQLTDEAIQGRKTHAGQVSLGAHYEKPTAAKQGIPGPALTRERKRLESLQRRHGEALAREQSDLAKQRAGVARLAETVPGTREVRVPTTEAEAQARLTELDKQYEDLLGKIAPEVNPYAKDQAQAETRARNTMRGRMAQGKKPATGKSASESTGGFTSKTIKTVGQEVRDLAERKLDELIAKHPGNSTLQKAKQLIEERDTLRRILNARGEAAFAGEHGPALPAKVSHEIADVPKVTGGRSVELGSKQRERIVTLGHAIDEQQRRVAGMEKRAAGKVEPTGFLGAEDFAASPDAVRIPDVPASRRIARQVNRTPSVGSRGTVGHLRALGSTSHEYTGALRAHAARREDTTALVGESAMEAAKYAGLAHVHELVRQAATEFPTHADDVAVRLERSQGRGSAFGISPNARLPVDVRNFLDNPEEFFLRATPAEQASVFENVRSRLFMDPKRLDPEQAAEFRQLFEEGKIGWVPRRLLGDLAKPHLPYTGPGVKLVDAVNNASRFAILYLKPAYAIPNLLGNAALTVIQEGFAAPKNVGRAVMMTHTLGPELTARIDTLMGEGMARAISAHDRGVGAGLVDKAAQVWSKGVDMPFRRASFLYEAERLGFKTPQQLERLLTDPAAQQRLVEVTQRANRELIDYSNLRPVEREVIRRVIFFYPWVKGSTVYAGRFLREHPVKAGVVGQVGQVGKQNDLPAPSYLEGSFDVGGRLVNPTSAAIYQTPAQVGESIAALAGGDVGQVGETANLLSPATALAIALATKRDRAGYAYPKGATPFDIAYDELVQSTPQFLLGQRISDAEHGRGQDRLYPPNVRDALLQYLVGGIAPRKYNRAKLAELARNEHSRYVGR